MIIKSDNIYLSKILEKNKELKSFVNDFNFLDDFEEMKRKLSNMFKNLSLDVFGTEIVIYNSDKTNKLNFELIFDKEGNSKDNYIFQRVCFTKKIKDLSITYFITSEGTSITIEYPESDVFGMPIETTIDFKEGNIRTCKNLFDYIDQVKYDNDLKVINNYKEIISNEKKRVNKFIHEKCFFTKEEKDLYSLKYDIKVNENDLFHLLAFDINKVIVLNVV